MQQRKKDQKPSRGQITELRCSIAQDHQRIVTWTYCSLLIASIDFGLITISPRDYDCPSLMPGLNLLPTYFAEWYVHMPCKVCSECSVFVHLTCSVKPQKSWFCLLDIRINHKTKDEGHTSSNCLPICQRNLPS